MSELLEDGPDAHLSRVPTRCPSCGKVGTRIPSLLTTSHGLDVDDSYCGYCGKRWPAPAAKRAASAR